MKGKDGSRGTQPPRREGRKELSYVIREWQFQLRPGRNETPGAASRDREALFGVPDSGHPERSKNDGLPARHGRRSLSNPHDRLSRNTGRANTANWSTR